MNTGFQNAHLAIYIKLMYSLLINHNYINYNTTEIKNLNLYLSTTKFYTKYLIEALSN